MKKLVLCLALIFSTTAYAGENIANITGTSVHTGDDILYIVDDPFGTPADRYIARSDLFQDITTNTVSADMVIGWYVHSDDAIGADVIVTGVTVSGDTVRFGNDALALPNDTPTDNYIIKYDSGTGTLGWEADGGVAAAKENFSYWDMGGDTVSPVTATTVSGIRVQGGNIYADNNLGASNTEGS